MRCLIFRAVQIKPVLRSDTQHRHVKGLWRVSTTASNKTSNLFKVHLRMIVDLHDFVLRIIASPFVVLYIHESHSVSPK